VRVSCATPRRGGSLLGMTLLLRRVGAHPRAARLMLALLLCLGLSQMALALNPPAAEATAATEVKICISTASWTDTIKVVKTDGSYSNVLHRSSGECTGNLNNTGSNPVKIDMLYGAPDEGVQFEMGEIGGGYTSGCNVGYGAELSAVDPIYPETLHAGQRVKTYAPDIDGDDILCGVQHPPETVQNTDTEPAPMADGTNCATDPVKDAGQTFCPNTGTDPEVY